MKHIRFLSDNKTICEKPGRLGFDFVVQDTADSETESCKYCSDLLFAHNLQEYEREQREVVHIPELDRSSSNGDLKAGIAYGLVISSFLWAIVLVLVLAVL